MILFAQSHFSLLTSVLSPLEICRTAKRHGYESVCLLDYNNLCAMPELIRFSNQNHLQPLIGAWLNDGFDQTAAIVISPLGFQNLCSLLSGIHCQPHFRMREQAHLMADLIFITDHSATALFLQDANLPVYWALHLPCKVPPIEITKKNIPLFAMHLANIFSDEDHTTRILMNSIRKNELISERDLTRSRKIYDQEEYAEQFAPFPDALEHHRKLQLQIQYRHSPITIFPSYSAPHGLTPFSYLQQITYEGAYRRYGNITDTIKERLDYELNIINSKNFTCYFLLVREIIQNASRTCGRGSGSGSIVSYCLFITNVDPIRHQLLFERFLSPDRIDYPDLDIDFAWDERDYILEFVRQRFGTENCAMVCNHIRFQPKMALRATAKAYGFSDDFIKTYSKDMRELLTKSGITTSTLEEKKRMVLKNAFKLIGHPRHLSLHCGGIVITPTPVRHYAPLQNSSKGLPIMQWEKDGVEEMGLVKIDLLGNRSLAVIRDAIANCKENGHTIDYTKIDPATDPETIEMLAKGDTIGVFYIESPAMRMLQKRTRKGDFDHIVIHSSIIRPASHTSIRQYTQRVLGTPWKPLHPLYEKITSDAYGVMVYEDHILSVAHQLAFFTYREANQLRKALSREDTQMLDILKKKFYKGIAKYEYESSLR